MFIHVGNPAPVEDTVAGKILLLFSRNMNKIYSAESRNEGKTWSNVVDITTMVTLPNWSKVAPSVPGGVQLPNGRLIMGKAVCIVINLQRYMITRSWVGRG